MSKKVLIIEDNTDIRENIIEILTLAGFYVYAVDNGKAGVELAISELPDIILCDIMMPDLDGYGVLHMLTRNQYTVAIPFIFLSAKAERLDLRRGMELGADDYLTKPFDILELLTAIDIRLKKNEIHQLVFSKSLDRLDRLINKKGGLEELKKITKERKVKQFKANQVIYFDGDIGHGLYLVISGKVKTIKLAHDGRELMTRIYTTDDYLGINAILLNQPYAETATALDNCVMCFIPKDQIDQLLTNYPDVGKEFIRLLANDIHVKEEQLVEMAYHSVRKKMAAALIRLSGLQIADTECFKITREDLAAMSGMALETVSRTLSDFKEEGLIGKKGSLITVLDLLRLEQMKN